MKQLVFPLQNINQLSSLGHSGLSAVWISLQTSEGLSLIKKSTCSPNNLAKLPLYGLPDREHTPSSVFPVTSHETPLGLSVCQRIIVPLSWIWGLEYDKPSHPQKKTSEYSRVVIGKIFKLFMTSIQCILYKVMPSPLGSPLALAVGVYMHKGTASSLKAAACCIP